jgi:hypothetical protein
MRPSSTRNTSSSTAAGLLATLWIIIAALPIGSASANDVNLAPASCQAPFLYQATGLRWHENYLMNPTWNVPTWVVCPMPFNNDELPTSFVVAVTGSYMSGASNDGPACFFTVNAATNTSQEPYRSGNGRKLTWPMDLRFAAGNELWEATARISWGTIVSALGDDDLWAASFFCRLPLGYSISQLRLTNDGSLGVDARPVVTPPAGPSPG